MLAISVTGNCYSQMLDVSATSVNYDRHISLPQAAGKRTVWSRLGLFSGQWRVCR